MAHQHKKRLFNAIQAEYVYVYGESCSIAFCHQVND